MKVAMKTDHFISGGQCAANDVVFSLYVGNKNTLQRASTSQRSERMTCLRIHSTYNSVLASGRIEGFSFPSYKMDSMHTTYLVFSAQHANVVKAHIHPHQSIS